MIHLPCDFVPNNMFSEHSGHSFDDQTSITTHSQSTRSLSDRSSSSGHRSSSAAYASTWKISPTEPTLPLLFFRFFQFFHSTVDDSLFAVNVVDHFLGMLAIGHQPVLFGELPAEDGQVVIVDVDFDWERRAIHLEIDFFLGRWP